MSSKDEDKFFKKRVFVRKQGVSLQGSFDAGAAKQSCKRSEVGSSTLDPRSAISSISKLRKEKRAQSITMEGTTNISLDAGSKHDSFSVIGKTKGCVKEAFFHFKRAFGAYMEQRGRSLQGQDETAFVIDDLKIWEENNNKEKSRLLTRYGVLQEYIDSKQSKTVGCALNLKTLEGVSKNMSAIKQGKIKLLKAFNQQNDHYLLLWGDARHGKVGQDKTTVVRVPTYFAGGPFKQVSLGQHMCSGIDSKGRVFVWGRGDMLGVAGVDRSKPLLLKSLASKIMVGISCGTAHTLALSSDGTVYSWVRLSDSGKQQSRTAGHLQNSQTEDRAAAHSQADGKLRDQDQHGPFIFCSHFRYDALTKKTTSSTPGVTTSKASCSIVRIERPYSSQKKR